ncbi:TRAP transporter substrate-binding protein [Roseomonas sp. NAR14]|uniref:TRAP transporter substrate-binding protein n=1 Tax=Roseomonas acroporae TaxID=2937791 RepID=A0A9X1Y684_9PROT|nr:TAXI family TRAP transporter solute-binding subunit [Roseomonas acroporae]MCK8782990.1 TRAP transporter substrate-binding protein [Roseomonas acroporae]
MNEIPATRRGLLLGAALAAAGGPAAAQGPAARTPAEARASPPALPPAAPPFPAPARPTAPTGLSATLTARANAGTVGVISGGVDGTYIRIAADLAAVLDDGERLRVLPMIGKGSVQNLADIIYLRGVDIGIVQSDVLAFVRRERLVPGAAQAIQYIAKLYDEEIHLLARREIARIEDLAGRPVNLDVPGSGTAMTGSLLFEALRIPVRPAHDSQDVALQKLRAGEIAALAYVAGKPARLFAPLGADSGLHFLPVPLAAPLLETYLPSQLGPAEYPGLVPPEQPVETVAVGAAMAVYAWQPGSDRHRRVARFVAALNEKFPTLQRPPRHPKWREVNLAAQVPGWTRFSPEQPPPRSPGTVSGWRAAPANGAPAGPTTGPTTGPTAGTAKP